MPPFTQLRARSFLSSTQETALRAITQSKREYEDIRLQRHFQAQRTFWSGLEWPESARAADVAQEAAHTQVRPHLEKAEVVKTAGTVATSVSFCQQDVGIISFITSCHAARARFACSNEPSWIPGAFAMAWAKATPTRLIWSFGV